MMRLAEFLATKRRIRRRYEVFANLADLVPLPDPAWAESAYWFSE